MIVPDIHCAHDSMVKIEELCENPRNPNSHPERQIELLGKIIREQGWRAPITVSNRSGYIVRGHGRLQAAQWLGLKTVPVDRQDYESDEAELADLIADNRIAELAIIDDEMLVDLIGELGLEEIDMELTGFDVEGLTDFVGNWEREKKRTEAANHPPEKEIPASVSLLEKWKVKTGDVWTLGDHRLICGDCTDADVVARLMDGEKADLVLTDPPYGVSYADKNKFLNAADGGNRSQSKMKNDHLDKEKTQALWKSAFAEMSVVMKKGAVVYCFMPQGGDQMMMMIMMMGAGIEPRHEIIWLKNNHVLGRTDYAYKHEPILYAWKAGGHKFYGDFQTSILEFARPQKSDLHPTMKPVPLLEKLITNSSRREAVVYDLFLGSGSTLIACENTGRKCYGMEIDPGYCSVILERWSEYTGKVPTLNP